MDDRGRALADIVTLARRHGLSAREIAEALGPIDASTTEQRRRSVLVRVLGFIGGTFVFAGVGVFIALQWDAMNPAARVVITLGSGLAAFVLAVLSSRDVRFDNSVNTNPALVGSVFPFRYTVSHPRLRQLGMTLRVKF